MGSEQWQEVIMDPKNSLLGDTSGEEAISWMWGEPGSVGRETSQGWGQHRATLLPKELREICWH